ncbi:MAG: cytochrome c1, partial [Blastomonas sp.]|nr:cytochrome c1 [Blastomonas sp.]
MIRIGAFLVGLFFSGWLLVSFGVGAAAYISEPPQPTAEHEFHLHPKKLALSSDGPMGKFDRQQLQRGFQVYKEVCSACHSMRLVAFRNLSELGYTEDEVKAIAANWPAQT